MKRLLPFLLLMCLTCTDLIAQHESQPSSPPAKKPHVVVLATGGTIASAKSSSGAPEAYGAQRIIESVPQLKEVADVSGEDVVNVDSADMTNEIWLKLANRLNALLREPDVDAVVITHGTDTIEETAYFLHLTMKSDKPVVMTGAMRKPMAIAADGPSNLFDAIALAVSSQAKDHGVMVVMNGQIFSARDITKQNSMRLDAFQSPNRGPEGFVADGRVMFFSRPSGRYGLHSEFAVEENVTGFPQVEILYGYADMGRAAIDNAVQRGVKGIVIAGVGNGSIPHITSEALAEAVKRGVVVVRSSRVISGFVAPNREVDDDRLGFVASPELNPQKSRVLLMLALQKTSSRKDLQQIFYQY